MRRVPPKETRAALRDELYARAERGDLDVSEAIRSMRKIAGKTQEEFARLVGVTPRVLKEIERGIGNPTLATLARIFAPFGLELAVRRRRDRA